MKELYRLQLQPTEGNTQVLCNEYIYKDVVVPKGFETNGQDSPRLSWMFGLPPFKPKYAPAYIVHDYMINQAKLEKDAVKGWQMIVKANNYYEELMRACEDKEWFVNIVCWSVKKYWTIRKVLNV